MKRTQRLTTTRPSSSLGALAAAMSFGLLLQAQAAVVLSTDFNNAGVIGGAMTGVNWTENGITAPTTLSATAAIRSGLSGDGDAEGGYFSPNANVNGSSSGSPAWSTTWTITVGANDVDLTSIQLYSAESNSGASLGAGNGSSSIRLTISGTAIDLTQSRNDQSGASQLLTYSTPVTLSANTSYDVTFRVWELGTTSSGHFESMDSVIFNGDVIPEPATLSLLAMGLGLSLIRRRR